MSEDLKEVTNKILSVLNKLPISIEQLKNIRIGRNVLKIKHNENCEKGLRSKA